MTPLDKLRGDLPDPVRVDFRAGLTAAADAVLHAATDRVDGVPGVVAMVTDRHGTVYAGAAGRLDMRRPTPMTADAIFALYSCTKAVTAAAVMQLVEAGRLALDAAAGAYVPELAAVAVLTGFDASGEPLFGPPAHEITVRQLLLHTAGFGYEFFNADLLRLSKTRYARALPSHAIPPARRFLVRDPGTRWEYGSSIDWAGKVLEAVHGAPLAEILQARIFTPLEMHDTGFRVPQAAQPRRAGLHRRIAGGHLEALDDPPPQPAHLDCGGSGLYSTASDYCAFIRAMLNDGRGDTGARILRAETVAFMARNALGALAIQALPSAIASLTNDAEFFPGIPKSWGVSWMINDIATPTGRPAGSVGWAGLANLFYWIDRQSGLGGMWATQILPFMDPVSLPAYLDFEHAVYAHRYESGASRDRNA